MRCGRTNNDVKNTWMGLLEYTEEEEKRGPDWPNYTMVLTAAVLL